MELVTAAEMLAIENEAVKRQGISIKELMALAGKSLAEYADRLVDKGAEIAVFCGKGNNGGDGFVAARHLANMGYLVKVIVLSSENESGGVAGEAFQALKDSPAEIMAFSSKLCLKPDMIIDALLGFGLKGGVRGAAAEAIEMINSINRITLAADVPSGVDSDTGQAANVAVQADHTITFTCPKIGLALYPGAGLAGEIHRADIGIWPEIVKEYAGAHLTDREIACSLLPRRLPETNKHRCGRVLVVAGSVGMTGAAAMTAEAALRAGAGIVTLAVPKSLNDILEAKLTEVMTVPLPETGARSISKDAVGVVLELAGRFDVVALGPGLSRDESTAGFVRDLLPRLKIPIVVDADGLNNLAGTDILSRLQVPSVVTPHAGELSRLIGRLPDEIESDRVAAAQEASRILNSTVVLKGSRTVISGHGTTMINPLGNPGMATAGTGDVLTGIISGLMAQGLPDYPGSVLGTYLHGLSGDLAAKEQGELAMTATDLIDLLPKAIKEVISDKSRGTTDKN